MKGLSCGSNRKPQLNIKKLTEILMIYFNFLDSFYLQKPLTTFKVKLTQSMDAKVSYEYDL